MKSISKHISSTIIGLLIFILTIIVIIIYTIANLKEADEFSDKVDNIKNRFCNTLKRPLWNLDYNYVIEMSEIYIHNDIVEQIIVYNEEDSLIVDKKSKDFSNNDLQYSTVLHYYDKDVGDRIVGKVTLGFSDIEFKHRRNQYIILLIIQLFVASFVIYLAANFLIRKTVNAPLKNLIKGLDRISEGNFSYTLEKTEYRELNNISDQFERMGKKLQYRERMLIEREDLLNATLNSTDNGMLVVNSDGKVSNFNNNFIDIWKLPKDIIQTFNDNEYLHYVNDALEDPEEFGRKVQEIYNSEEDSFDYVNLKDGRVLERYSTVLQSNGKNNGRVWSFRDVTSRIKAEQEKKRFKASIQHSQKMEAIGTLAGGIAHDFNNILTGIVGTTELLISDLSINQKELNENLEVIMNACVRAKNLIKQILMFSKQSEEKRELIYLKPICKEIAGLLRASIPASIHIESEYLDELNPVYVDGTKIHEILMNLGTNAIHAIGEKGYLKILLETQKLERPLNGQLGIILPGTYSVISVIDDGAGIRKEVISHIFEPFYTTKGIGEGTGMGLSVVFGIIKSHDGNITVESTEKMGSTFKIFLPQVQDPQKISTDKKESVKASVGSERILFVDDESIICRFVEKGLKKWGYNVETFDDSKKALDRFNENPNYFDIAFFDLSMPGMTGVELIKYIRETNLNLPVFLCTGNLSSIEEDQIKALGIQKVIKKPYTVPELISLIREKK